MIFRGYVKTKNKECLEAFKDHPEVLKTYDEIKVLDEFAGVIANDFMLVDIDNQHESEILLRMVQGLQIGCKVTKTTKGMHFFFKSAWHEKNGNKLQLAIGLHADIKLGSKSSYAVCKFKGKEREILYDKEPYDAAPKWLCRCKHDINFPELNDGDGRNQALFSHILPLQSVGFTKEECKECIQLMNRFVLEQPIEDDELEKILRDDAFNAPVFTTPRGKFLHNLMGDHLINTQKVVKIDGLLHVYHNGVYVYANEKLNTEMVRLMPAISRNKRQEVIEYIKCKASSDVNLADSYLVNFLNGVFDARNGKFMKPSSDEIFTNQIPHIYNPNAYHKELDEKLDEWCCGNKSLRMLLEEMMGYCLIRNCHLRKIFVLFGNTTNGKSTFLKILTDAIGEDNCTFVALQNLGDRFQKVLLHGKLANICDDIGSNYIDESSYIKQISSGDSIMAEIKYGDSFSFKPYSTLIFSANDMPRIKDRTGAVKERMVIIPFRAQIKEKDRHLVDRLTSETAIQYFLKLAIDGLMRIVDGDLTKSTEAEAALEAWSIDNDSISAFLYDKEPELVNQCVTDIYTQYEIYCRKAKFQEMSSRSFYKFIKLKCGLDTKQIRKPGSNEKMTIFVEEETNGE